MKTENAQVGAPLAVALLGMLAALSTAPAFAAGAISTGSGVQVWNGHNCAAIVPVNIAALSAGLSGYENKIGWDPARFTSAGADISINISTYLTNGGTRQQTGDGGTPALKLVSTGAVKYGAYSWGTGNPPGNQSLGQLATISIKPTATCGGAAVTMAETLLLDTSGIVIALTSQTGGSVAVLGRFDTSASGTLINSADVNAVVARLNQATGGACGPNYRYDTSLAEPLITSADVTAVVANLNRNALAACVQ